MAKNAFRERSNDDGVVDRAMRVIVGEGLFAQGGQDQGRINAGAATVRKESCLKGFSSVNYGMQ